MLKSRPQKNLSVHLEQMLGKAYSENMAQQIDKEVQDLVAIAYERTKNLVREHRDKL